MNIRHNEHYRQAMLRVSELQHAGTSDEAIGILDDLVHHLTRLSDDIMKQDFFDRGPGAGPGTAA